MENDCNILIDYFKVRFDFIFEYTSAFYTEFLALIHRSHDDIERLSHSAFGYEDGYRVGVDINIFSGGEFTRNNYGELTSLLELKGSACREFEEYGGSWLYLFELVSKYRGSVTRIDIAVDEFSGSFTIDEIKEKIMAHQYVSKTRNLNLDENLPEEVMNQDFGDPAIRTSNNKGFTATFGGRGSSQLCIYNKKAEREAHGYIVPFKSWIRFELRYYHQTAKNAYALLHSSLLEDDENGTLDFSSCVKSFLAHSIEFKESGCDGDSNISRHQIWKKWDEFCRKIDYCVPKNQSKLEKALFQNYSWFLKTNKRILLRLLGADRDVFIEFINYTMKFGIESNFSKKDLQVINNYRVKNGMKELSHEEFMETLKEYDVKPENFANFEKFKDKFSY